jgi:hypothetical protein
MISVIPWIVGGYGCCGEFQYCREELTPGANVSGEDRALTPGSAIGMYRLYDAGREVEGRVFVVGRTPEEGPRGP